MKKNWQERFDEMSEMNEFYGLPYNDLVDSSIKQFISDIIAQTKEETIRKMEEVLPNRDEIIEDPIGYLERLEEDLNKLKK